MIGKIITTLFVVFIVGCYGLSIISTSDSKSFIELQMEAEKTCITNYTLLKESRRLMASDPSEVLCPLHCVLSKLGFVNEGGPNKILVNWTRKLFELEDKESIFSGSIQELGMSLTEDSEGLKNRLDAIFDKIRTINGQFEKACTAADKEARNQLLMSSLTNIRAAFNSQPNNQSIYIPSAENSRYLELFEDAAQKCMSNYNVTVLSLIRDIKSKNITRQNICIVFCMNTELGVINENGFNKIWIDYVRDYNNALGQGDEFEALLEVLNRALPIFSSYCSSNDIEVIENDFESIKKLWLEIQQLSKKTKKTESDYDEYAEA